jgi:Domain of unknown function (DUF4258)
VECKNLIFSGHAIQRMFYRRISKDEVRSVITYGEIIEEYPNDEPFPCCLLLDYVQGIPIHVVLSMDEETETCYVVTAYIPDLEVWQDDFRTRR